MNEHAKNLNWLKEFLRTAHFKEHTGELLDGTEKDIALLTICNFNKPGTVDLNQADLRHHFLKTKDWLQVVHCSVY